MTRYLVDTNVVSATAPTTAVRRPELIEWMDTHSPDLFQSAITIAEIADGIARARREGAQRKASHLSAWLKTLLHLYGDRVLSFDNLTAEIAGSLADWRVAVVIPRALPISQLLQLPVSIPSQSSRAMSAISHPWMSP